MAHENDPEEFVGATQERKADPKGKRAPVTDTDTRVSVAKVLAEELASPHPGTPIAVYTPPAEGANHPKHAILGPAQRLDAAEVALNRATLEEKLARDNLRARELAEAEAEDAFIKVLPGPTFDEVNRQRLADEQAAKIARVEQGLPAVEPKKIVARSPVDLAAAQRPRTSPQAANQPLRSPVARRLV
jgi:hypothetical protein